MSSIIPRNPSATFMRLNPHLFPSERLQGIRFVTEQEHDGFEVPAKIAKRTMSAPALNKTEQRWQAAHPLHIPFPLRLRWGNSMHYSPDFLSRDTAGIGKILLIEVKGGFIRDRDIVRYRGCAAEWEWLYRFEMWQWKSREWTRIY